MRILGLAEILLMTTCLKELEGLFVSFLCLWETVEEIWMHPFIEVSQASFDLCPLCGGTETGKFERI